MKFRYWVLSLGALAALGGFLGSGTDEHGTLGSKKFSSAREAELDRPASTPRELVPNTPRVRAAAVPKPPDLATEAPVSLGELRVRLQTAAGMALSHGHVLVRRSRDDSIVFEGDVDPEGRLSSPGLPPGDYWAEVREDSLEPPYVPAWLQSKHSYRASANVQPGRVTELTVLARLESIVWGYVVAPGPHAPTVVRFYSQEPHRRWQSVDVPTDSEGRYETRLDPGTWRSKVLLGRTDSDPRVPWSVEQHPWYHLTKPLPQVVRVLEGAANRLDLMFQEGSCSITGVVFDLHSGDPAEGLRAYAYPTKSDDQLQSEGEYKYTATDEVACAKTAADGSFSFQGLPAGQYGVAVEPSGCRPDVPPGENVLGKYAYPVEPIAVRGTRDIGRIGVWLSRPFWIEGRIDLDPTWPQATPYSLEMLVGRLTLPPLSQGRGERYRHVALESNGTFRIGVETPEGPVTLEFSIPGMSASTRRPLTPVPGETVNLSLRFPETY